MMLLLLLLCTQKLDVAFAILVVNSQTTQRFPPSFITHANILFFITVAYASGDDAGHIRVAASVSVAVASQDILRDALEFKDMTNTLGK